MNKNPEQEFLNQLFNFCTNLREIETIFNHKCRVKNQMDFEANITLNDQHFLLRCEAKVASQTNGGMYKDRFNVLHKIFGEIIKGRNLLGAINQNMYPDHKYGLLIHKRDFNFFNMHFSTIISDWNQFGETFDCKFVVVFDLMRKKLIFYDWHNCWHNTRKITTVLKPHK